MDERDKEMLMASVANDNKVDLKHKLNQYKSITEDQDYFDYELLKIALDRQENTILDILLRFGCRVRNPNRINSEESLLYRAVKLCDDGIIRKMLIYGASIYDKDADSKTAIHAGFKDGYHNSINTVLSFYYLKMSIYVQTQHLRNFKDPVPKNEDDVLHFHIACILNNVGVVGHYLKYGFNVNRFLSIDTPEFSGLNPLLYAATKGQYNMFKCLLQHGADLSIKNADGLTAPQIFYYSGEVGKMIMKDIFELGNDTKFINSVDKHGVSHFHLCCMTDHPYNIKVFIGKGVDINSAVSMSCPKNPGFTPLHFAVRSGHVMVVKLLLQNGASHCCKADKEGTTAFHLACNLDADKATSIINFLLIYNKCDTVVNNALSMSSPENPGYTALHFAAINGYDTVVKLLVQNHADCNKADKEGNTPLHLACGLISDKTKSIVGDLLNYNASATAVNRKGCTPLHTAFYSRKYENTVILDMLISSISENTNFIDDQGLSHFHIICTRNSKRRVEEFLKSGVAVDACVTSGIYAGYTALHFAALYGQKDAVEMLLKSKARVDVKTNMLFTPLHFACECNFTKVEEIYIQYVHLKILKELNVKQMDTSWLFNRNQHLETVKLLLGHKADVEAKDCNELTPLLYMFSVCLRDIPNQLYKGCYFVDVDTLKNEIQLRLQKITEILLSNKANINARTDEKSIWDFISENRWIRNSKALDDFLRAKGAKVY